MAEKHVLKFYPVGNGDTSQIVLSGGRRVLLDFCHRPKSEDDDTPEIDLKQQLKDELTAAKRDNFDVVHSPTLTLITFKAVPNSSNWSTPKYIKATAA